MDRCLGDLLRLIRTSSTLGELSGHLLDQLPAIFGVPIASFLALNTNGTPRSLEFSGRDSRFTQRYWEYAAPHDDVRKLVLASGRPTHDMLIRGEPEWRKHPMYLEFGAYENLRHYGASPIIVGAAVRGLVGIARRDGDEALDAGDLLELTLIALHVQDRYAQLEGHRSRAPFEGMSGRQLEVCRQVSLGRSNLEIAEHLRITGNGVKAHLKRIFALVGVESRDDLAAEFSFWFSPRA